MTNRTGLSGAIGLAALLAACGGGGGARSGDDDAPIDSNTGGTGLDGPPVIPSASFFVTSVGNGSAAGNYGGVAGADTRCNTRATAGGLTGRTWHAYLSTSGDNARDRIGAGPWFNTHNELIANNVAALHANGIAAALVIDENGAAIDLVNAHDILTGSDQEGRFSSSLPNCNGFTTNDPDVFTTVGHANGGGVGEGGVGGFVTASWNSAHITQCDQVGMQLTAGRAHLYCFAI